MSGVLYVSSNSSIIDLFLIIGTCYMFVAEKKTYLEAKAYCEGQVAKVEGAHFCCLEIKKTYVINSGVCLFVPKFWSYLAGLIEKNIFEQSFL